MAWELPSDMHEYIEPSIAKAIAENVIDPSQFEVVRSLGELATQQNLVVRALTDQALERSSVTRGGHEVYLDTWCSIPWCTRDEMLQWWS